MSGRRRLRAARSGRILAALALVTFLPLAGAPAPAAAAVGDISTVAGQGTPGYRGHCPGALNTTIGSPHSVAVAPDGSRIVAIPADHRVVRVVDGQVMGLAGTGEAGPQVAIDDAAAVDTPLNDPSGVAVDGAGHVYLVERSFHRVRRVDATTGVMTIVAGSPLGTPGYLGDGGQAAAASLSSPEAVDVDGSGSIFILEAGSRVRRVDGATGIITTDLDGLTDARGLAVTPDGTTLYVSAGHQVWTYNRTTSSLKVRVGDGTAGFSGDGLVATNARVSQPSGLAVDAGGHLLVADANNHRIRRVDAVTQVITTVIGNGTNGFTEGSGAPTTYQLSFPRDVGVGATGGVDLADGGNHRVRSTATGRLLTVAGNGPGSSTAVCYPPLLSLFDGAGDMVVAPNGDVYVTDRNNNRIRRMDATTGLLTTIAGNGPGFSGDGGPAVAAQLWFPGGLVLDHAGNLFIADTLNRRVRKIDTNTGIITTVAGNGQNFYSGDGGQALAAGIPGVQHLALDPAGGLLLTSDNRVRRVAPNGIITTVAGNGTGTFSGDGGPATAAGVPSPEGIAVDPIGNTFMATSYRIRKIDAATGTITTIAGDGTPGYDGEDVPAATSRLRLPRDLVTDAAGNLFVAEFDNRRIRRIDAVSGLISTVAGNGTVGFSGDGGPAVLASIGGPTWLGLDADGTLYFTASGPSHQRIRRVERQAPTGKLRVTTSPAVPATITVNGVPRDAWGLTWMDFPVGSHEVCFGAVSGFRAPPCEVVTVHPDQTTVVEGAYAARGYLRVSTSPAVPATIFVDGVPRNDWGMWTEVDPGNHQVCYGEVADMTPPLCTNVVVVAGITTHVIGQYTAAPGAPGPSGHGYLRVTTSPATGARITIDGEFADTWGLTWLKLDPGSYQVCFEEVLYATTPPCKLLEIIAGQTTELVGVYGAHGFLQVSTSPAVPAVVYVDGQRANAWGVYVSGAPGPRTVCFGALPGLVAPPCQVVAVTAGATTAVNGTYG